MKYHSWYLCRISLLIMLLPVKILSYWDLCFVAYFRLWILVALQSKTKICPSDVAIIPAGFYDLLTVFSSETPLRYKLVNMTFASVAYNKSVMIGIFLGTQPPWTTQLYIVGISWNCLKSIPCWKYSAAICIFLLL